MIYNKYKYSESEIKEMLSSITIIIDTREKSNEHIVSWFDKNKIKYVFNKLDYGDYSFLIPKNEKLLINRDIYYDKEICVERKSGLDELAGNFSNDRNRIEDEMLRHKGKMHLIIEGSTYGDIYNQNYKSKYTPQSFIGTLHSFSDRYDVPFIFLEKDYTAKFIYFCFYYFLRNIIK